MKKDSILKGLTRASQGKMPIIKDFSTIAKLSIIDDVNYFKKKSKYFFIGRELTSKGKAS